jgi:16S rRNA G527 N7-methylase RsmG
MPDDDLVRVLSEIQRRGAIGPTPLREAIAHADRFVHALPASTGSIVDLGSGGGLPGLVIAHRRRDVRVSLVERRAKRADLLRYGVRSLGLTQTVAVIEADVDVFAESLDAASLADTVTARSFGPPLEVLHAAAGIVCAGGTVLVSEPPAALPRLSAVDVAACGFVDNGSIDGIRRFTRFHVEHH